MDSGPQSLAAASLAGDGAPRFSVRWERQLNAMLEDDATEKKAENIPKFVKLMQGPRSIMAKGAALLNHRAERQPPRAGRRLHGGEDRAA